MLWFITPLVAWTGCLLLGSKGELEGPGAGAGAGAAETGLTLDLPGLNVS